MLNKRYSYLSTHFVRWQKNLKMMERSNAFPDNPYGKKRKTPKVVKSRLMQIPKSNTPDRAAGRSGGRK